MARPRTLPPRRNVGFTMAEIVTMVALVTIVAGMTLPRIDLGGAYVDDAVAEVTASLADARSRATLSAHDVVVRFDTTAATVFVHLDADDDGRLDDGEETLLMGLPEQVRFGRAGAPPMEYGGAAVTFAARHGGLPSVTFHAAGTASESGAIYLVSGTGEDASTRAVEVTAPNGLASCSAVSGGVWTFEC